MCGGGGSSQPIIVQPPKLPPPPAPLPVPTVDTAAQSQTATDALLTKKGRAADILTGPKGDLSKAPTGTKQLLGS